MKQDRDRLQEIMEMFHQGGQTMISADSLRGAIECGDFEVNGFARDREEAQKLGQAMIEQGFVSQPQLERPLVGDRHEAKPRACPSACAPRAYWGQKKFLG